MDIPDQKVGKLFLTFAGICLLVLPLIVISALSYQPDEIEAAIVENFLAYRNELREQKARLAPRGRAPGTP